MRRGLLTATVDREAAAVVANGKEAIMTATTLTAGRTDQSWTMNAKRLALVAVAIVVLVLAAFVVGRATVSNHVSTGVSTSQLVGTGSASCLVGRPC
jgi:hypothetical protein